MNNVESQKAKILATKFGYIPETIERFISLFGLQETEKMLIAYEKHPKASIRTNTLKITPSKLKERLIWKGFALEESEWDSIGFIVKKQPFSLGSTTEHLSGMYFIQSQASWLPVIALDPKPEEIIVDLAAAPGGKATHIAQKMKNKGVLFCIDISRERMRSLRSNLSRCGVINNITIRMDGTELHKLGLKVDKILLDAPCSGEGLMAIDKKRRTARSLEDIKRMAKLQKELLSEAILSLKEKGTLVYSTCSTAPEENEEIIDWAIKEYPVKIEDLSFENTSPGLVTAFNKEFDQNLKKTVRLFPHKNGTEGFFVAKLSLKEEVM